MKAGKVFQGMREALISFPPTYKFEKHRPGLAGYDSGEKKRIPAWCDRVIYRDNRPLSMAECSLECPVVTSVLEYDACMDVTDSDHKPVRCKLALQIAHVDRSIRRVEFGKIMKNNEQIKLLLEEINYVPETQVNTNSIVLQSQDTYDLRITNKCTKDMAIFDIRCEGQSTVKELFNLMPRSLLLFLNRTTINLKTFQSNQATLILYYTLTRFYRHGNASSGSSFLPSKYEL